jgi:hypothetical protein
MSVDLADYDKAAVAWLAMPLKKVSKSALIWSEFAGKLVSAAHDQRAGGRLRVGYPAAVLYVVDLLAWTSKVAKGFGLGSSYGKHLYVSNY